MAGGKYAALREPEAKSKYAALHDEQPSEYGLAFQQTGAPDEQPKAAPDVDRWSKLLAGAKDIGMRVLKGSPFKDELGGVVEAVDAKARGSEKPFGDLYREGRDAHGEFWRGIDGGGLAGDVAEILGGVPSGIAASAALPGGLLATGLKAVGQGAIQGSIAGLDATKADLTKGEIGDAAKDVALGAGVGATVVGVAPYVFKAAKAVGSAALHPVKTAGKALQLPQKARDAIAEKIGSTKIAKDSIGDVADDSKLPSATVKALRRLRDKQAVRAPEIAAEEALPDEAAIARVKARDSADFAKRAEAARVSDLIDAEKQADLEKLAASREADIRAASADMEKTNPGRKATTPELQNVEQKPLGQTYRNEAERDYQHWRAGRDAVERPAKYTSDRAALYEQMSPTDKAAFIVPRGGGRKSSAFRSAVDDFPMETLAPEQQAYLNNLAQSMSPEDVARMKADGPWAYLPDELLSPSQRYQRSQIVRMRAEDGGVRMTDDMFENSKVAKADAFAFDPSAQTAQYSGGMPLTPETQIAGTRVNGDEPRNAMREALKKFQESDAGQAEFANKIAAVNDEIAARGPRRSGTSYVDLIEGMNPDVAARNKIAEAKLSAAPQLEQMLDARDSVSAGERLQNIARGRKVIDPLVGAMGGGSLIGGPVGAAIGGYLGTKGASTVDFMGHVGQKLLDDGALKSLSKPNGIMAMAQRNDALGDVVRKVMQGAESDAAKTARSYMLAMTPAFRAAIAQQSVEANDR